MAAVPGDPGPKQTQCSPDASFGEVWQQYRGILAEQERPGGRKRTNMPAIHLAFKMIFNLQSNGEWSAIYQQTVRLVILWWIVVSCHQPKYVCSMSLDLCLFALMTFQQAAS